MKSISGRNDYVCHRGVETTYNTTNLLARSHVFTKKEHGVGEIYFLSLDEVTKACRIRIHNTYEKVAGKVFSGQDILKRLSDAYMGEYHFLNNNCEHFVKWARNDKKVSHQWICLLQWIIQRNCNIVDTPSVCCLTQLKKL